MTARMRIIQYRAVKVMSRPTTVEFFTKDGKKLRFKALESYEVADPDEMKTPDLIRWLRKNGFKSLAMALRRVSSIK